MALGLAILVAVLLMLAPSPDDLVTQTPADPGIAEPAGNPAPGEPRSDPADIADPAPHIGRNVTPDGITSGPPADGPLRRLPPRELEPAPQDTAERASGKTRQILLPRPIARDIGHLMVGRGTITLPGITPLPLQRTCGEGADAWPCGTRARTALRGYLRSRSIRCEVPEEFGQREETITSACTLRGQDIGAWIVRNGWAEATPGGPYGDAEAEARREKRGIWR
ncbi:thermonuclease family protein [Aurantimonas sp. A2-1-M11]|uniref:thermonuclease family protein n=1 Tax=Aurantimonas sp. A2-1-M11 TaxID=3113712 RepID=UPI002F931681